MRILRWGGVSKGLAKRCAWCNRWHSLADKIRAKCGADVSHGICEDCRVAFDREAKEAS